MKVCVALALASAYVSAAWAQTAAVPLVLPSGIVFDAQGNLYFAETGNHVVRKFSVVGVLTTVAGDGVQGYAGDHGPAVSAELDSPAGLAVDSAGNLYVADSHNHCVREVDAKTGAIETIAGMGVAGFSGDGRAAIAARLDLPTAVAVDAAGNMYVADTRNHRVRRIAVGTGMIDTVAGDGVEGFAGDGGAAVDAAIDSPNGLAVDAAGNLYIADTHNGRVRVVDAKSGKIATVGGATGLALPHGLALDSAGNLYVADSANHRVRRISAAGAMATVAGEGTEAFAGDGGAAVASSLDSPRGVAISPAGLVTLTDSGNQRVRQVDALPAPGPDIHTLVGAGGVTTGTLVLSGPAVVAYGGGAITATVGGVGSATGNVTFLDTVGGATSTVGVVSLNAGSATFPVGTLGVGSHNLVAVYGGDVTHEVAQSAALTLSVTPLNLVATPNAAAIVYGQTVPVLGGTLSGVLAQDAGKVTVVFTTSAGALSPVGVYPITAMLTGSAAGNYTVSVAPANLSIARAPSTAGLTASTNAVGIGMPVTLTVQAASTTSGVPTGSVTLLDGASVVAMLPLSGGGAAFTTSALLVGGHVLSASYSGDANFLPSTSAVASVAVSGAASDFTLTATGATSQTVPAGTAATFNFSVAMQGAAMASPIVLAVQGAPVGATASLNPSSLPPGGAVTAFTLTVQTPLAGMDERSRRGLRGSGLRTLLALLVLPAFGLVRRSSRRVRAGMFAVGSCFLVAMLAGGCGNRINRAESVTAKTYTLTVTGTATSPVGTALQHSAVVTLEVL
jgi:sugar lactone lactonase YvrE